MASGTNVRSIGVLNIGTSIECSKCLPLHCMQTYCHQSCDSLDD
ncbi:hypothetical protein KP509_19G004700 [Ceratopteris richardii]|uniref:Uncharacterized protein n=1 Tax=Ceratopteris richardii TaxID=49495 RepID=A0A8T2SL81_CERRI|nr:hypothetical protein KP509_19G004700 [Ceratopteris richardii]